MQFVLCIIHAKELCEWSLEIRGHSAKQGLLWRVGQVTKSVAGSRVSQDLVARRSRELDRSSMWYSNRVCRRTDVSGARRKSGGKLSDDEARRRRIERPGFSAPGLTLGSQ